MTRKEFLRQLFSVAGVASAVLARPAKPKPPTGGIIKGGPVRLHCPETVLPRAMAEKLQGDVSIGGEFNGSLGYAWFVNPNTTPRTFRYPIKGHFPYRPHTWTST
jgi:hypothetical protein